MEYLYETHMHTSQTSACAISSGAQQARVYKQRGYTGIIVTDHFINGNSTCPDDAPWDEQMNHFVSGYLDAKSTGEKFSLDVFFGWEFSTGGLDFLTYGLDIDFLFAHPGLDKLSIEEYSSLVRNNGGFLAQAHPFRVAWYLDNSHPVEPHLIDAIEVFNSSDSYKSNEKTRAFAEKHNLPMQAGSDSHSINHSLYSGIVLEERADGINDIIRAIKDKKIKLI